jgi:hypothetical protein
MKKGLRTGVVAGALALVTGFAWGALADDKAGKPAGTPLVRAEARADASARPDLSGTWKLNEDLSEDPRKKMQEAGGGRGGGGGTGGGGGMGGGGGGGAMRLSESFAAEKVLTISHKDPQLVITDLDGRQRTLFTDARRVEEDRSEGTARIRARWNDRSIVVVTKVGEREVTETYERAAVGARLVVTMKIDGGRAPFSYRRVYEKPPRSRP